MTKLIAAKEHPLVSFAARLEKEPWLRRGLFACATLIALLSLGYFYGTYDQAIHIPFLKAWSDPTLYPNDPFLALRYNHYSFFWLFFIPFYRLGVLEPVLFISYLLCVYLTFQATWELAYTLFEDPLSAFFAVVAMVLPHMSMVGFPIFEFSLLNRTFVLPFTLMAISMYLRGRRVQSFLLLGLMYNLHVLTVNFAMVLLLMASLEDLIRSRWKSWKMFAAQMAAFVLAALPVLIWRFGKEPLDFSIRPEWVYVVGYGMLQHLLYLFAPQFYILAVNIGGVAALGLFWIAERSYPSPRYASTLRWMAVGALLVLLVQVIVAYWLPVTFIMEMQIARVSTLLLILCLLYFAHYLAQMWRASIMKNGTFIFIAGSFFAAASSVFPLLAWALSIVPPVRGGKRDNRSYSSDSESTLTLAHIGQKKLARVRPVLNYRTIPPWAAAAGVILSFAICVFIGVEFEMWKTGIHIYPPSTPWVQTQLWAKNNTPKDAIFITPPQLWDVYDPDWRVFSDRSDVATITDVLEIALIPEYLDTWLPRFKALAPGAYEQFNGNFFHSKQVIAQAYYSLSEGDLLSAACQFHADYLVFEKPNQRNFPVIYQNNGFVVYDLSQVKSCGVAAKPQN